MGVATKVQAVLAVVSGVLGVVTIFWRDWIEAVSGWDPDHGNGAVEWAIVAGLLVLSAAVGSRVIIRWRRSIAAPVGS
jgi:hypothetical protein